MSSISKCLSLRVPADVIYRGLKDTRLEQLFPEFFTGVTRRLTATNNANSELQFTTTTYDHQHILSLGKTVDKYNKNAGAAIKTT